jgi:hypothetical protein
MPDPLAPGDIGAEILRSACFIASLRAAALPVRLFIQDHQPVDRRLGFAGQPQLVESRPFDGRNAVLEPEVVDELRDGRLELVHAVLEALDLLICSHGLVDHMYRTRDTAAGDVLALPLRATARPVYGLYPLRERTMPAPRGLRRTTLAAT